MRLMTLRWISACLFALSMPAVSHPAMAAPLPPKRAAIQAAIDSARPGDTLAIAAGTIEGNLIIDKNVTLIGAGKSATIFHAPTGRVITVGATVTLENMTVSGLGTEKVTAIYQRKNSDLTVRGCHIADAREDGIGYDPDFNSVTRVFDSEVAGCGDGIDVESTQAIIINTRFEKNRDDGLDLDGDAGVTVINCVFSGNRDDGIEVRLERAAHLLAVGNTFENNGEDGIELIDSPLRITDRRDTNNIITVAGNTFRGNKRFGVGGVSVVTEEAADTMVQCALFGSGNKFEASGKANFSKNLWPVDLSQDRSRQTVEVRATSPGGTTKTKLPIRALYPVAVYNLHPSAAGDSLRDGEGLTVGDDGTFALLA
ncbi:MAG: right-handed parallel beta-helix repeat-containing protein, partial [Akkermansiaceae bacterium]|nr:right-handed parallel beta-helix repeat-containing protein [Armatimonadota bacterium]